MITSLSILIPTRNDLCTELVRQLSGQAAAVSGLDYEIIVADDGSTDADVIAENGKINGIPHCKYLLRSENIGRAAIRNWLSQQASKQWLLFIDSDMAIISDRFLKGYLSLKVTAEVVYGGYKVIGNHPDNLRFRYEKKAEHKHNYRRRRMHPYLDFHTSNFLIHRETMLQHPLNEKYRGYGYEDVAYGKALKDATIVIMHINNPVGFCKFESNSDFMAKTEESLRTLKKHRDELCDYSRIIRGVEKLRRLHALSLVMWLYNKHHNKWRKRLCTDRRPSLLLLKMYKIGYYVNS